MSGNVEILWDGNVATIRLNDPVALNALTISLVEMLDEALDEAESRARAIILTGAGRGFCSGANITAEMDGRAEDEQAYDAGWAIDSHINPLVTRLRALAVPWISAVRGPAAGLGAALALAGDMVIASETAYFLQSFARVGLVPDGGASHLLVRTIGRPRAMELMLLGERLPAEAALQWGLVNRVVADADLETEALATASRLADAACSLRLIRRLAWNAVDAGWQDALAAEREMQLIAGRTADHREGVRAFIEKRPAIFRGA